ncbi:uncharacterized protein [Fopius arisanus]|uniref:Mutator-like transposase domain-containing protein n=1 Tax=Fopius arisanus TaxID=64838 RepID=A0A9R1U9L0_9HYME|nr:PREDICTED: uncharacterized protein LOC105272121 [Fopius arisanus]
MARAKANKKSDNPGVIGTTARESESGSAQDICSGRRIVDIPYLAEKLKCHSCQELLSLKNIEREKRMGLHSLFTIRCKKCLKTTIVSTGKTHTTRDSHQHADVNTKAILGTVHAGVGCTGLNKVLACLNVPTVSSNLFKRYEREVGPAIEESAKESCRRAAQEERKLVIENIDKLCDEL